MILGDHHTMVTVKKPELKKYGAIKAPTQVPLVIVDGSFKHQEVKAQFQQIDVFNGLAHLNKDYHCTSNWVGDIFKPDSSPKIYST